MACVFVDPSLPLVFVLQSHYLISDIITKNYPNICTHGERVLSTHCIAYNKIERLKDIILKSFKYHNMLLYAYTLSLASNLGDFYALRKNNSLPRMFSIIIKDACLKRVLRKFLRA